MRKGIAAHALVVFGALYAGSAHAQTKTIPEEYGRVLHASEQVEPLSDSMFGESVNLYNGATEFSATDLEVPGNNSLPVKVHRRYVVEDRQTPGYLGGMGEWDLDVPHIKAMVATIKGWTIYGSNPGARCTTPSSPQGTNDVSSDQLFHGYSVHVPGQGDQPILKRSATTPAGPTDSSASTMVTKSGWHFTCLPATKNGYGGEAFVGRAPDGTKYYFDYVITKAAGFINATGYWSGGVYYGGKGAARSTVYFVASRVEDPRGNWVNYTYTGSNLTSISSSDGRAITIHYNAGLIDYATAHGRTVNYGYTNGKLTSVQLPDNSFWRYSNPGLPGKYAIRAEYEPKPLPTNNNCLFDFPDSDGPQTFTVTHPSGATAVYTFGVRTHKKSFVPKVCMATTGTPGYYKYAPWSHSYSILSRVISGPGLLSGVRTYTYPVQNFLPWDGICQTASCPVSKFVVQQEPDGSKITYEFGIKYNENDGQLLSTSITDPTGVLARTTINEYVANSEVGLHPFASSMGYDFNSRADDFGSEEVRPLKVSRIEQDGATFTMEVQSFDAFAHPVCKKKYSSLGFVKFENTEYAPNTAKWVLDLIDKVTVGSGPTCASGGAIVVDNTFDAYGAVTAVSEYGVPVQTYKYNADGTLATVTDALNQVTAVSDWHRGVPRAISFPTTTTRSATVSDFGSILSATDENEHRTCYSYDLGLRLSGVTYPSESIAGVCDALNWNPRSRNFSQVNFDEYGIEADHWRLIDYTGTGRKVTYFDAMWRPVLVLTEDTSSPSSKSFVVNRYDLSGNRVFQSYPTGSLESVSDSLPGIHTMYDGLGRITSTQQDSENVGGLTTLTTSTAYVSGFKTQVTNPRGLVTTTAYQAFDQPTTDAPVRVDMPEGVSTLIQRQPALGKPISVTRTGPFAGGTLSATKRYVYGSDERLCETIEPESGATIVSYDDNGNVLWTAEGQNSSVGAPAGRSDAQICSDDRATVALASRVTRSYDALNRELTRTTTGGTENVVTTYHPDGQVKSLTATNPGGNVVTTTYTYNRRRLLTREALQVNGLLPWNFDYSYNPNAHLSSLTYPGNLVVGYSPDGLGRPTQAGTFASEVKYYPNGAMSSFKYGNGIEHTMTQNARLLPSGSRDVVKDASGNVTAVILDDSFTYDANGNVLSLVDASAASGTENRTWGVYSPTVYDGLDRLVRAVNVNQWGFIDFDGYNAVYTYDPLDNLRSNRLGASLLTYGYDGFNRLASLSYNGGAAQAVVSNGRGEITANAYRGQAFQFDLTHRLSEVTGKESYLYDGNGRRARTLNLQTGTIEYYGYGKDGRLLQDWSNRRQVRNGYIYLGNTLVGRYVVDLTNNSNSARYEHTDALGSPVVTTNASKTVLNRMSYTPYGLPTLPMDGVGYTGHFMDVGTQLTYMQQRYYDPQLGRMISVDPVTFLRSRDLRHFNRFSYSYNNPLRFSDPDGRCPACDRFGDQFARDAAAGNLDVYEPMVGPAAIVATAMLPGGPLIRAGAGLLRRLFAPKPKPQKSEGDYHAPGDVPNGNVVVRGGTGDLPPAGTVMSGSQGRTVEEASRGVPHGQIRTTTAGDIRASGGKVEVAPEATRSGQTNGSHVNVTEGTESTFGPLIPNQVPKAERIQ